MGNGDDGLWSPLYLSQPDSVPSRRVFASEIVDPVGRRLVVFGGLDGSDVRNDTWVLGLDGRGHWHRLSVAGDPPPARWGHSAVYDPLRRRMLVVCGALDGSGLYGANDVWALSLDDAPRWTRLIASSTSGSRPSPRYVQSAVYDQARDRLLVFGGYDGGYCNDVWAVDLAAPTPAWWGMTPSLNPPSRRDGHAAVYDAAGDRMIVFGGWDGARYLADIWQLALAGPLPTWSRLTPAGASPPGRRSHAAVYDPVAAALIAFGGDCGPALGLNDAWALSLSGQPAWRELGPTSSPPSRRWGHSAAYDPAGGGRLVCFGGSDANYWRNDTWALPLSGTPQWEELDCGSGPRPRTGHSVVYDAERDRMIVFGGLDEGTFHFWNEVWAYSFGKDPAWALLAPEGGPPAARCQQYAVHDALRGRLVVCGGIGDLEAPPLTDTWSLTLSPPMRWVELHPLGAAPPPRTGATVVHDPLRDRMVLFGGFSGSFLNDAWELDLPGEMEWRPLVAAGNPPSARVGTSGVYDPVRDRILLFGGLDESRAFLSDVWALPLTPGPEWSPLQPSGVAPAGRGGHAAIYDAPRDRMLVFGGDGGYDEARHQSLIYNDTWALDLAASPAWRELSLTGGPPSARYDCTMTVDPGRSRLVIYGGEVLYGGEEDVWALDLTGPTPALASLMSAQAMPDRVRLAWYTPDGPGVAARVERRREAGTWSDLGEIVSNTGGLLEFEDRAVISGEHLGYRLRISGAALGEVWVVVPGASPLALAGFVPNPAAGRPEISFRLPTSASALLEVMDLRGRRVLRRDVGKLGAGEHRLGWDGGASLAPGLYWIRLSQSGRTLLARGVVLH
jgi:hypothetical protein